MRTYVARQQDTLEALDFIIRGNRYPEDEDYCLIAEQNFKILLEDLFIEISLVLAASYSGMRLTNDRSCLPLSVTADCSQTVVSFRPFDRQWLSD